MAQAAKDYQLALRLSSREEWDTDAENEADGATKNPYAAWGKSEKLIESVIGISVWLLTLPFVVT